MLNLLSRSTRGRCALIALPAVICLLGVAAAFAAPVSYVSGGSFEAGAAGWSLPPGVRIETAAGAPHGRQVLRLAGGMANQDVLGLRADGTYTITAWYRLEEVRKTAAAGYAFVAVYQLDDVGEILSYRDFVQSTGTAAWQKATHTFQVAPGARVVSVRCGLFQAEGTAWFDGFTLVEGEGSVEFAAATEQEAVIAKVAGFQPAARGNVAVYRDDIPAEGAPSNPEALAGVLRRAGYGVALLDSDQLADPNTLNRATFDVLVLPQGPAFPVKAAESFRRFLRRGGKFLSAGGYAFDNLLEKREGRWRKPAPPPKPAIGETRWRFPIPAADLRGKGVLTFSGQMRSLNVGGEGFAFLAVYQYGAGGKLVEWKDVCHLKATEGWADHRYDFDVHEKAEVVELHAGLYLCRGVAWADSLRVLDAGGRTLVHADLSKPWDPDAGRPRTWCRPDKERCTVDPRGGQAGGPGLKMRLDYFIATEERLNTRNGKPGDGLQVAPTQLGVFQADFRLERAVALRPAPSQCVLVGTSVSPTLPLSHSPTLPGLQGYAAVGSAGWNEARWQPLLDAVDRYGRPRGAAGALLRHYAGTYSGSSWAFFGVTNRDLFAAGAGALGPEGLVAVVADLVRDIYLARVVSEPPAARPGEEVTFRAPVFNGGRQARKVRVTFALLPESGKPAHQSEVTVEAPPGQMTEAVVHCKMPAAGPDYYRVLCEAFGAKSDRSDLSNRSGARQPTDRLEGGLVVLRPEAMARGPRLSLKGNYLRVGGAPRFLFGTDDWSYVFSQDRETPAQWRFDMAQRRDYGVQIYENLQVGMPASPKERDAFLRKTDGVVQLAQKYGQVYFAGLLIGYNVAAGDEELARQAEWCGIFARRYRDVPGLIYYPNGDLRCQITAAVTPQWNQFLTERYATDAALRAAWGDKAPKEALGRIPAVEYSGSAWDDVRAYDTNLFRGWLIRRWNGALIRAIKAEDPDALTSCEFYQLPHEGIDIPEGIGDLDLSNIGYFDRPLDDIRRFPAIAKYSDQRARGKSLGPGEYGVKTHPAWGDGKDYGYHITRTPQQAVENFLAIPHYSLGLGGSRIHNWCWKDCTHRVFPWGMVFPGDNIAKGILNAHRAQSLLFRQFRPVYREPEVYVLTPDAHRLGGRKYQVIEGILNSIHLALAAHVDNLGVLNERNLAAGAAIPAGAKVLFYPLPYCPSDAAYGKVLQWVRAGGTLYLSGDISYDETRRRTRAARLEELCGVRFLGERYANTEYGDAKPVPLAGAAGWTFSPGHPGLRLETAGAQGVGSAPDGSPAAALHAVGKGRVIFLAEPVELHATPETRASDVGVYRKVLELAGVKPLAVSPDDPFLHVMRVPLEDGGNVWVLFNADESRPRREVTLAGTPEPLTFVLGKHRPGLAWFDGQGRLRALEATGGVRAGGRPLLECAGQTLLFSTDGADLRRSRALAALPLAAGRLRLPAAWKVPAAAVGEVREGRWRAYETLPLRMAGGLAEFPVSPDAAGSVVLLGERAALSAGGATMEALVKQ